MDIWRRYARCDMQGPTQRADRRWSSPRSCLTRQSGDLVVEQLRKLGKDTGPIFRGLPSAPGHEAIRSDKDRAAVGHPISSGPAMVRVGQVSTFADTEDFDRGPGNRTHRVDPDATVRPR